MYEDFFLNNSSDTISTNNDVNLDILFNNLTSDVENVNKMIANLNRQKESNSNEHDELSAEKRKLHKMQEEFETYMRIQRADLKQKVDQTELDIMNAKQALERVRNDFNSNMNKSLLELDVAKKEIELEKDKLKEDIKQFESYKNMEMDKIHHSEEILKAEREEFETAKQLELDKIEDLKQMEMSKIESHKKVELEKIESLRKSELDKIHHSEEILKANQTQFEKYKEICNQKIEIENKKLEQKFEKFKGIVAQFNDKFKPVIDESNEE